MQRDERAEAVQRTAAVPGVLQCSGEEARELASTVQCGTAVLSGASGAVQRTAVLSGAVPVEAAAAAVKWTEQCCAETARLLLLAGSFSSFFQKNILIFQKHLLAENIYWVP